MPFTPAWRVTTKVLPKASKPSLWSILHAAPTQKVSVSWGEDRSPAPLPEAVASPEAL